MYACTCQTSENYWNDLTAKTLKGAKRQATIMYDDRAFIELAVKTDSSYDTIAYRDPNNNKWTDIA